MFCPNCGNAVEDNALHCPHCGNQMNEEVVAETVETPVAEAPVEEVKAEAPVEAPVAEEKACQYCGTMVPVDTKICPVCNQEAGDKKVEEAPAPAPVPVGNNIFAILGLVGAFVCAIAGIILSIIGLNKAKALDGKGKGLAIAGLIISIISTVVQVLLVVVGPIVYFIVFFFIIGSASGGGY